MATGTVKFFNADKGYGFVDAHQIVACGTSGPAVPFYERMYPVEAP